VTVIDRFVQCSLVTASETATAQRCKQGWQSPNCTIREYYEMPQDIYPAAILGSLSRYVQAPKARVIYQGDDRSSRTATEIGSHGSRTSTLAGYHG